MYRQKSQLVTSSTHSLSAMYVLTGIHQLETTVDSCLDRVARDPGHTPDSCVVARVRGQGWQCGGGERVGREAAVSQDMFADSEGIEEEQGREGAGGRAGSTVDTEEVEEGVIIQLPLNYQMTGPAVWEERTLMSPFNARPLLIAQIKESRETVQTFFRSYMDPQVHLVTHYFTPPSWEGGQYCLWSPRGRQVVREEECSRVKVQGKTILKNPLRLKHKSSVEETEEMQKEEDVSRKRKRPDPAIVLPQTEVERRRQAYMWMVGRGALEGVRIDHSAVSKLKMFDSLIGKK